ncbi:MAG: 3-hydroxyacyl-CoA dehydrogenase family protein, partial [Vallitaleaceae bacterium]|nr:3-hydroxyacyl-CoA dehydrogenase family protein [Vallitaleaceae bacterium]
DIKDEFVDNGYKGIAAGLKKLEEKGALGGTTADSIMAKCSKSIDLASAVKDVDLVIEAVIEKMDIKKDVAKTVIENGPSHIIFGSNTSTMSITEIGKDCGAPDRVCGIHFFNPVPLMRLVEVIKSEDTSENTMNIAMEVCQKLPCLKGQRYIAKVLKDRPGFIVNRVNAPVQIYLSWVFDKAAEEGKTAAQIDADAGGKAPMPPCVLSDFVGIDTMRHVMEYYKQTLSPDFEPGKVIKELYDKGHMGNKGNKQGLYDWTKGRDAIMASVKEAEPAGIYNFEVTQAIMLNEGCRILEEGVASGYKVIDDANMAGMNTPGPFAEGVKKYQALSDLLVKIAEQTGKDYLKPVELMKSGKFIDMA